MSVRKFSVSINSGGRNLVDISNYVFEESKITFLFGESGIGKSLISKAIYGLLDPDSLEIDINGLKYSQYLAEPYAKAIRNDSMFVFQEPSTHLNPLQKLGEQIREGSLKYADTEKELLERLWHGKSMEEIDKILELFPKPFRPSGGEKQRILLAMAFKKIDLAVKNRSDSTYFVFDEPTGSLDNRYRNLFLSMLVERFKIFPFTVKVITHDYSIISELDGKYPEMMKDISLKELSRNDDHSLVLQDFSANKYLEWLHDKNKKLYATTLKNEIVLRIGANFGVFGRNLLISKTLLSGKPDDLVMRRGEVAYIKAASGVGKTTLAKLIMGLYRADKISIEISGIQINEKTDERIWKREIWGKKAGMVFQHADESLNLESTVKEIFSGLKLETTINDLFLLEKLTRIFNHSVSRSFLAKKVAHLSGGQKQALNLLRTFLIRPDLIILDEPLNGLDFNRVKSVLELIAEGCKYGSAILIISHNEEIVENIVPATSTWHLSTIN